MPSSDERWMDSEAGPVVRPYALTRGRTRHVGDAFDLIALVSTTEMAVADPTALGPERILLADLRELGLIAIRPPILQAQRRPDKHTLWEVLNGLRGL